MMFEGEQSDRFKNNYFEEYGRNYKPLESCRQKMTSKIFLAYGKWSTLPSTSFVEVPLVLGKPFGSLT